MSALRPTGRLLALPIEPVSAMDLIVRPALADLPQRMNTRAARVLLIAIALQESGLRTRVQDGGGPARGLWQFERAGVLGVLQHDASFMYAAAVCGRVGFYRVKPTDAPEVHRMLATDDKLACQFARLLLWTDPQPLPGDAAGGWALYLRTWRPGKPRPADWLAHFAAAHDAEMPF